MFGANVSAFNVFLLGRQGSNFTFDMISGDVEGRLAVNGSLRAISFGVGSSLVPCNSSLPTVIVGGVNSTIDFEGGIAVRHARGREHGPHRLSARIRQRSTGAGKRSERDGRQLHGRGRAAQRHRQRPLLGGRRRRHGVPFGAITFTGTANATQAFTVNASDVNVATSMTFKFANASAVESVVVSVVGNESVSFSNFAIDNGGVQGGLITFVVCSSRKVTVSGFELDGQPAGLQLVGDSGERSDRGQRRGSDPERKRRR